jgi:hypothetical protein
VFDIKYSQFFDRDTIIKKIGTAKKRVLSKAGAFIRQRAKTSIRRRKKSSKPGEAPSSHVGLLRDLIFFAYDNQSDSVVVGPQLLNGSKKRGSIPPPRVLEDGGEGVTSKGQRAFYHKFPYMAPALEAERPKFPELFADSVK